MNNKIQKSYQSNAFGDRVIYTSLKGSIALDYPCYLQYSKFELKNLQGNLVKKNESYGSLEVAEERIEKLLS
ncbi:hypothetical protein KMW28_22200 [Flammeovirga yaeyamensis]|uniref:Uncharacterized protein n=2 Tax=Flammeovirga TaxID=59739 RepID=A0AAX1NC38_9BACT|nr:hypothetical protein [Flammeovirga yaeyamensis]MBB3696930.1 hypothetical protein [Flammeovirga yaeyamensis]NMF33593.1 hypothetical protein [Flammeovirga yaeyamensis]QWG05139.1 hypothetical protein KMW28_22200 [Flammeovirga yaeyamensis]